jgi:hypothetical protein
LAVPKFQIQHLAFADISNSARAGAEISNTAFGVCRYFNLGTPPVRAAI